MHSLLTHLEHSCTNLVKMSGFGASFMLTVALSCSYGNPTGSYGYDFKFYKKSDWGAEPATDVHPLSTPVPYVVIHHTYIPGACYTTEECAASMRPMQTYHQSMDWGDIGYNFCVGGEGGAYEGRGWEVLGIHAGKANNYSIGICLIGDFRTELPPPEQLETTSALIKAGVDRGYISPEYKLLGHRQAMATECPGDALYTYIQTLPNYVPEFVVPSST